MGNLVVGNLVVANLVEDALVDQTRDLNERRKADAGEGKKNSNQWILLRTLLKMLQYQKEKS
jgi:hypothetical protein